MPIIEAGYAPLFMPQTVAVVGASRRATRFPTFSSAGFANTAIAGDIYPIHPIGAQRSTACTAYPNLGGDAEAGRLRLYCGVGSADSRPMLKSRRAARVRFAQVISSGFGEVDEGKDLQQRLLERGACRRHAVAWSQLPGHIHAARTHHVH